MRRGIYRAIGINRKGKYSAFLLVDQPIRFKSRFDGRFLFLRDIRLCLQNLKWNPATQEQDISAVHIFAEEEEEFDPAQSGLRSFLL